MLFARLTCRPRTQTSIHLRPIDKRVILLSRRWVPRSTDVYVYATAPCGLFRLPCDLRRPLTRTTCSYLVAKLSRHLRLDLLGNRPLPILPCGSHLSRSSNWCVSQQRHLYTHKIVIIQPVAKMHPRVRCTRLGRGRESNKCMCVC